MKKELATGGLALAIGGSASVNSQSMSGRAISTIVMALMALVSSAQLLGHIIYRNDMQV